MDILRNTLDLVKWVTNEPNGCITLNKAAPFLRYPHDNPNNKPQIKASRLPGHDIEASTGMYGIQKYALVVLGHQPYDSENIYTTTCGNPLCMNPDHIVVKTTKNNNDAKPVNKGSLTKLRKYQQVMRMLARNETIEEVSRVTNLSKSCIRQYRKAMLEDLFGDDYNWKDFLQARDIMDGMRWSQERRMLREGKCYEYKSGDLWEVIGGPKVLE